MPTISPVVRISLKNILVPEDFSSTSNAALPFVATFARTYGSTVWLAHVIPPEPHLPVPLEPMPLAYDREREIAIRKLSKIEQELKGELAAIETVVERGALEHVIPQFIEEHEIDLVVLGTHGRRGLGKVVLGSEAEQIYRAASCPVLTIGPKVQKAADWKLRRILVAVDLAEDPDRIVHYALSLAEEHQAELLLVHAVPLAPWQHRPLIEERAFTALKALVPADAFDWCEPQCLVRWEHPAQAILAAAEERQSDLIVMGVHRARVARLSSHLPWPIAAEVVSRAPSPVLTVRV